MNKILLLLFSATVANNVIFTRGVGFESADESSYGISHALKYGVLFTVITAVASLLSWAVREYVIEAFSLEYLKIVVYTLVVIVSAVIPTLTAYAIFPRLYGEDMVGENILTSFALFGVVFILDTMSSDLTTSVLYGTFAALGMMLALILFSLIRDRLELADVPKSMRDMPIMLVSSGIVALIFSELSTLVF